MFLRKHVFREVLREGETGTTTGTTSTGTTTTQQQQAPAAIEWDKTGLQGEDLGWVQNKGWKTAADAVKHGQGLEKMLGGGLDNLVRLPKDLTKVEDLMPIYGKLGHPKEAKDYGLDQLVPKGADGKPGDPTFANHMAGVFHKHGVPASMAKAIAADWNTHIAELTKAEQTRVSTEVAAGLARLQGEWGANFQAHDAVAGKAIKALGVSDAEANKFREVLGVERAVKLFHAIGSKIAMDDTITPNNANAVQGGMTAEQAQARLAEIKASKVESKKYAEGDPELRKEVKRLNEIMAGALS